MSPLTEPVFPSGRIETLTLLSPPQVVVTVEGCDTYPEALVVIRTSISPGRPVSEAAPELSVVAVTVAPVASIAETVAPEITEPVRAFVTVTSTEEVELHSDDAEA